MAATTNQHGALRRCMLVAALLAPVLARADEPPRYRSSPFHVSMVPPLSFPRGEALRVIGLSLDLPYGRLSGLYGIEAGLINREDGDAAGVQVGGVANWVDRDAWGIQIAGGMNRAAGHCGGVCLAGGINWHSGGGGGIQVAGLINGTGATWTGQRFVGFGGIQIGGIVNLADIFYGLQANLIANTANNMMGLQVSVLGANMVSDHFAGVQISLGANLNAGESGWKNSPLRGFGFGGSEPAKDDFFATLFNEPGLADPTIMGFRSYLPRKTQGLQVALLILNWADVLQGMQLALFYNIVVSQLEGVQIAPLGANSAYFDASGAQIALAYNKARTLKGIQVGLVNVCRTLYGVQVGLVNVCRTLHGFQIGAVNVAYENWLPFMIGMNAGF